RRPARLDALLRPRGRPSLPRGRGPRRIPDRVAGLPPRRRPPAGDEAAPRTRGPVHPPAAAPARRHRAATSSPAAAPAPPPAPGPTRVRGALDGQRLPARRPPPPLPARVGPNAPPVSLYALRLPAHGEPVRPPAAQRLAGRHADDVQRRTAGAVLRPGSL